MTTDVHPWEELPTGLMRTVARTAAESAPELEPERPTTKHVTMVISVLVVSALIMILNETVLSVAVPNLMAGFRVGAPTAQWLTTGFMLTMAVVIPTTGLMLPIVVPGAVLLAGGQWWLSTVDAGTSTGLVVAMHVVFCIGMAMLMTPLMTVALGALPRELYGHGSAIMTTLQQLAGAAGVAVLIAAMTVGAGAAASDGAPEALALVLGSQDAFVVGGVLGLVALVASPFVHRLREDAHR